MSAITSTRVIEVSKPGGPEVLKLATRPLAPLQPHEILVKVAAAGVNGHDVGHREKGTTRRRPARPMCRVLRSPARWWRAAAR